MADQGAPVAIQAELLKPGEPVDVSNCEREPIHIPGSVQPYGILLTLRIERAPEANRLIVMQASASTESLLGMAPEALVGHPLHELVGQAQASHLLELLDREAIDARPLYLTKLEIQARLYDAAAHRAAGGELVLELEPITEVAAGDSSAQASLLSRLDYYALVRKAMPRFHRAPTVHALAEAVADEARRVSGYDRVMIYRFDTDGHGSVIAEARDEELDPFLGLHYPASDIPPQARRLYMLNPLRVIADVEQIPARLIPGNNPETGAPLDMSHCILRSSSPIHVEYLKNMGVKATLTISLIDGDTLWGLIACHHYTPRTIAYDIRAACEFIGQVTSLLVAGKQEGEDLEYRARQQAVQARLVAAMSMAERYQHGLVGAASRSGSEDAVQTVLDLLDAGGAAVSVDGECVRLGNAPPEPFVRRLAAWLSEQVSEDVWATDVLSQHFPEAARYTAVASGVLAMSVTRRPDNYILWFRPEVVQTVDWAGDPKKAVTAAADGSPRLSPRGSFGLWQETLSGHSIRWRALERNAAADLRRAIVEVVLRQTEHVARLNAQLARSNRELDDFAYAASHDLKEPLRGLQNYAHFLAEDYSDRLDEAGQTNLATLGRLTNRMEGLLDSLLAYSRFGRMELNRSPTDLNTVLADVREDLRVRLMESGAELRIPRPLPTVDADPHQVSAIFSNLISNAAKYNAHPAGERWIEVGYREQVGMPIVFYVQDNGIGIREQHFDRIFRLFKRLHGRDAYGGGSGAGLTIARKIAERHGGQIWLESTVNEGTTFFFTLATDA